MPKGRKKEKSEFFFDYSLLFNVLFLLGFGMIMIYSASSYTALIEYKESAYFLRKQLTAVIIGLIAMTVVANIPYRFWTKFATTGYIVSAVLIVMVLSPLGVESHNARRWIGIPGTSFNLQPAEVAKIAVILFVTVMITKMGKSVETVKGFLILAAIPLPLAAMIYFITDNLSSAIIVVGIAYVMIFVADPAYKKYVVAVVALAALVALIIYVVVNFPSLFGFRGGRIIAWLDPESDAKDKGFQTVQALYAIGSGGVWGKGLGKSMQKLNFLPEAQNDMIFSVICEELGILGGLGIIILFVMLIWRMMVIANNAPDLTGAMMVVGVMGHIAIQTILNIAVVTNTIPNTGISLPFISYGGSSVIFLLIEIGFVLNVAKQIELKEM